MSNKEYLHDPDEDKGVDSCLLVILLYIPPTDYNILLSHNMQISLTAIIHHRLLLLYIVLRHCILQGLVLFAIKLPFYNLSYSQEIFLIY